MKLKEIAVIGIVFATYTPAYAFKPPSADQIIGFANNPMVEFASDRLYQELARETFVRFLRAGKQIPVDTPSNDHALKGPITLHGKIPTYIQEELREVPDHSVETIGLTVRCQGVAATREKIYFWVLKNDNVLWISDGTGPGCYLRVDKP
jgi:hypothetical protein